MPRLTPRPRSDASAAAPFLIAQTLGAARLTLGDILIGANAGMLFPLLVRLLFSPGMSVSRGALLNELWPTLPEERRRGNLRQALYKLRGMGLNVAMFGDDVKLDRSQVGRTFCVDRSTDLFERDVLTGHEPLGPFLAGWTASTAEYQQWVEHARETVHADVRRVLVEHLRGKRELADWTTAETIARWLLQFDPLNEEATLTLAECTMMSGAKVEAVAILDRYLADLGPGAGDIRLPATQLRRRFMEPPTRRRPTLAADRHFVGRNQELADMTLALRRARWHDGSAVLLHGPPGIGKTRLVAELTKVAQIEGFREVVIECRESDQHRPLAVLLEVLPELLNSPGALGCAPESLGVLRRLAGLADHVFSADPSTPIQSNAIRRAFLDLLGAVSDERPMFLVVEDVHWIDVDSWEILSDVAQRTQSMRIFLLETSRSRFGLAEMPDRFPASLQGILLGALPDEESTNLTRALGSDHHFAIPSDVEAWIIRAGEGSPLMLQALVTYWIETRNASGIPPTISILLESRLDRLSPNALRALQTACLLGRFSSLDRIQATLQLPNHELLDALQQLEEANCLFKNDTAFIASHELLGRAAINRLPRLVHLALLITIARTFEADFTRKFSFDMLAEAINYFARAERLDEVARISSEHYHAMIQLPNPKSLLQTFRSFSNIQITELPILGKVRSRLELEVGEYANAISNTIGELKLPDSLNTTSISDVDSLLSAIDSAHRADPVVDRSELAQFVAMVANHANFPLEQRFRAAEIGLVIAANTCDPKVAEQCFNVLNEAEKSNELDPQRLLMLYHTIFGEHSTAQKIARHFIQATGPSHSILDAQDHGKAGFTLRICGEHAEARKVFISAYHSLINLGAEKLAQYPAWQIAQMAIDVNEAAEANDWHEKLLALFDEDDEQVSTNFINAHSCRYEIFRGNAVAANDFLQRTTASLPRFPTIKASAYVIALEIATKLLDESWIPDEVLLSAARNRYRSTAKYGTTDFLAGTICHCLERLGRKQEAIQFLDQYLKEDRREIGPLSAYLNNSKDRLFS